MENRKHLISIKSHETGLDQLESEYRKRRAPKNHALDSATFRGGVNEKEPANDTRKETMTGKAGSRTWSQRKTRYQEGGSNPFFKSY